MEEMFHSQKRRLEGKVAVITGGARGIGEATAHCFASHGLLGLVIADVLDEQGQAVASSINKSTNSTILCTYIHCDVTDEDQVQSLMKSAIRIYGRLDILFSNAGIMGSAEQTVLKLDQKHYEKVTSVNSWGMAACVKHAGQVMIDAGIRGSIVCTASVLASTGGNSSTDYNMSKHAVLGLVRAASVQLGQYGIRVNCVSPGAVGTELMQLRMGMSQQVIEELFAKWTCLKGITLKAEHVANAVLFLASEESDFVTGLDLIIDGGLKLPAS